MRTHSQTNAHTRFVAVGLPGPLKWLINFAVDRLGLSKMKTKSRQQADRRMPPTGTHAHTHARTHAQTDTHVEDIVPPAVYRTDGGGISMVFAHMLKTAASMHKAEDCSLYGRMRSARNFGSD